VGDLFVEVKVEVPETLSTESQRLMEALAADTGLKY
jgi:DnaJ-class molecular chaperone